MRLRAIDRRLVAVKKILFIVVCVLVIFAGCDKAADAEKTLHNKIIGDWSISYAKNASTDENIPLQYLYGTGIEYGGVLTFHENNTFERHIGITGDEDATKGTYSLDGDVITLKYDNGVINTAIYLPSSQEIKYRLEGIMQSPVNEYYIRVPDIPTQVH